MTLLHMTYRRQLFLVGVLSRAGLVHADEEQDLFPALLESMAAQREKSRKFSFTKDGIHPGPAGHLLMAQTFLRALAARTGQILNLSDLSREIGVSVNTAKAWISILEASFQIFILRPYYANIGKRLVKSPKVYFMDTGLLCYLVGLRDVEHAASGPMGGAIFENLVVAEFFKIFMHRGEEPALYYWRTTAGSEVDLVIETQGNLVPLEVKLSNREKVKRVDVDGPIIRKTNIVIGNHPIIPVDITLLRKTDQKIKNLVNALLSLTDCSFLHELSENFKHRSRFPLNDKTRVVSANSLRLTVSIDKLKSVDLFFCPVEVDIDSASFFREFIKRQSRALKDVFHPRIRVGGVVLERSLEKARIES